MSVVSEIKQAGRNRRLSVVAMARALIILMGVTLLAGSLWMTVHAWGVYAESSRVQEMNAVSDDLFTAIEHLAVERGVSETALRTRAAASAPVLREIAERRAANTAALRDALEGLESHRFEGRAHLVDAVKAARGSVEDLRQAVDAALERGRADRPREVVEGWTPALAEFMQSIETLSGAVGFQVKLADPFIAEQTFVKELAWQVRSFAGQERALIGQAIAEEEISQEDLRAVARFRGQVDANWRKVIQIAARSDAPPVLTEQVAQTESHYFERFQPQADAILFALEEGFPTGMDGAGWFDLSDSALATIMQVKAAAIEAGDAHLAAVVRDWFTILVASIAGLGFAAALTLAALRLMEHRLAQPIKRITELMTITADTGQAVEIPFRDRRDEIGAMAGALGIFQDKLQENLRLQHQQVEAQERAEAEKNAALQSFMESFQANVGSVIARISSAAGDLQGAAVSMTGTAERTAREAGSAGEASEMASANVQTVASAAAQLTASIAEIGRQVQQSAQISDRAVQQAERTGATIRGLEQSAAQIGQVVDLIKDIAEQTNLLALNATIEAARAGDAGRGFAVVAQEVKSLASQTATATERITAQIGEVQSESRDAVAAIESISGIVSEMNEIATTIASAVEEQSRATDQIAENVQSAAEGTSLVSGSIGSVGEAAEETGSAAEQVLSAAKDLGQEAQTLQSETDKVLERVRAA